MAFKDFAFEWRGERLTIPVKGLLLAIDEVEEIATLQELAAWHEGRKLPYARLARAFAVVLRHAGQEIDGLQVLDQFYGDKSAPEAQKVLVLEANAMGVLHALMALMVPPEHLRAKDPAEAPAGKGPDGEERAAPSAPPTGS